MKAKKALIFKALLTSGLIFSQPSSADIFYYESSTGESLISDHAIYTPGMVLRKTSSIRALYDKDKGLDHKSFGGSRHRRRITAPAVKTTYDRAIRKVARQFDVQPSMVKAIMHAESYFNPKAVSLAGAQGLMQLMPKTAKQYGVKNAFNPEQNLEGALRYLSFLQTLFPDKPELVIAAYNAGENAVFKYQGIPPYDETQDYVKKVVALKRFYDLMQSP